ncbi:MAG: hypothetical protein LBV63_04180 [Candidatus Methanoplasma sp.]|jgi:hypothetical protein|nr:hypothetical protein [Candidatus Methanoplasma sp.]
MRYVFAVLFVIAVSAGSISASVPVSAASGYEAFFDDDEDIQVTFPYGSKVDGSGILVFKARSDKYDLHASSIYFLKADSGKVPDPSDRLMYSYNDNSGPGRTVTYTIHNIRESFKIEFAELVLAPEDGWSDKDYEEPEQGAEDGPETVYKTPEDNGALAIMSLVVATAAALLVFSAYNLSIVSTALDRARGNSK